MYFYTKYNDSGRTKRHNETFLSAQPKSTEATANCDDLTRSCIDTLELMTYDTYLQHVLHHVHVIIQTTHAHRACVPANKEQSNEIHYTTLATFETFPSSSRFPSSSFHVHLSPVEELVLGI